MRIPTVEVDADDAPWRCSRIAGDVDAQLGRFIVPPGTASASPGHVRTPTVGQ